MFLLPKRVKFNKSYFRRSSLSIQSSLFQPIFKFGQHGLVATSNSFLVPQQINSALRPIRKYLKKQSKILILNCKKKTICSLLPKIGFEPI
jgi:ribosomal protein L16/L10AE